jgi:hypothetical protein
VDQLRDHKRNQLRDQLRDHKGEPAKGPHFSLETLIKSTLLTSRRDIPGKPFCSPILTYSVSSTRKGPDLSGEIEKKAEV